MVYPDGEVLTNLYDSGGKLRRIDGEKTGFAYPYLDVMTYDKFGQRTFMRAGNGTETSYAYVPTTRRLDALQAGNAQGRTFQDLSYAYDLVGNQTGWDHVQNGTRRTITWDEENRIQAVVDNGQTMTYRYDDAGERVIKSGPQGETAYVNQFWTIRNREVGTMHVFAGGTRLVSKLVRQPRDVDGDGIIDPITGCDREPWGWTRGNGGGNGNGNAGGNAGNCPGQGNGSGPEVFEADQYFYHPDHLGSSSYVTDIDGEIFQHLEYFPFGETWVEESSNTQRTPYLFTGKELDEETGLYYFGARYYDPRTSVWQSPDPILASYMRGERSGRGVYMPANMNLYAYSHNRPVVMFDPNGLETMPLGNCYSVCTVADVTISGPGDITVNREFGTLRLTYLATQPPEGATYTGTVVSGISHYMQGSGRDGFEPLEGMSTLVPNVAERFAGSGNASGGTQGTFARLAAEGGGTSNITVGLPSTFAELTAGAVQLSGSVTVTVDKGTNTATAVGYLVGQPEPFDFNRNQSRGVLLDGAVGIASMLVEGADMTGDLLSGSGQTPTRPFTQNYTGRIEFSYTWDLQE